MADINTAVGSDIVWACYMIYLVGCSSEGLLIGASEPLDSPHCKVIQCWISLGIAIQSKDYMEYRITTIPPEATLLLCI